jgi:carbamoyl-phosphate synthase large subunit
MKRDDDPMRLLFTCVGRRVELINAFHLAARRMRLPLEIWGADQSAAAPAMAFVDKKRLVPGIESGDYAGRILRLARRNRIHAVIPLIDHELIPLAEARPRFERIGCNLIVSDPRAIAICRDKLAAYRHLIAAHVDTPSTWTIEEIDSMRRRRFPYFVKPRSGSAGAGLHVIENAADLAQAQRRVQDPIVQEFLVGREFTMDVYFGMHDAPKCIVARRRLQVRGGEVSRAQIQMDRQVIAVGRRTAESIPGLRGVVTIQCIRCDNGRIAVIEINPRFGGGVPLSIAAGADMPGWLLAELTGRKPRISATIRKSGLMMSRYDQSVFKAMPIE